MAEANAAAAEQPKMTRITIGQTVIHAGRVYGPGAKLGDVIECTEAQAANIRGMGLEKAED